MTGENPTGECAIDVSPPSDIDIGKKNDTIVAGIDIPDVAGPVENVIIKFCQMEWRTEISKKMFLLSLRSISVNLELRIFVLGNQQKFALTPMKAEMSELPPFRIMTFVLKVIPVSKKNPPPPLLNRCLRF